MARGQGAGACRKRRRKKKEKQQQEEAGWARIEAKAANPVNNREKLSAIPPAKAGGVFDVSIGGGFGALSTPRRVRSEVHSGSGAKAAGSTVESKPEHSKKKRRKKRKKGSHEVPESNENDNNKERKLKVKVPGTEANSPKDSANGNDDDDELWNTFARGRR
uniref:Uncharacterized protein n=1 Tax=Lotharella oceanica TaxID=641309 RepID=A0A7S2XHG5_9EUKA|mmetsp:Transcript_6510/g.12906  ORF Transcript_6510/g.12906 Transcript_6510/m.12906 type:complete len:162 (+) Transcript_6510:94-579(+)